MENHSEDKAKRILEIYTRLRQGKIIYKAVMSETYGVSQRTIQRDISDIQCFLQDERLETGSIQEIIFDKRMGGYLLRTKQEHYLDEKAVLAVCRILLESRALIKKELFPIIQSLLALCSDDVETSLIRNLLQDGMNYYKEPQHGKQIIDQLWILEQAVKGQRYIEIIYDDSGDKAQKLRPVRVMLLECCFYLIAYILNENGAGTDGIIEERNEDKEVDEPVLYRIDRIQKCMVIEGQIKGRFGNERREIFVE